MPILKAALPFEKKTKSKSLSIRSSLQTVNKGSFYVKRDYYCMPLTLVLCVGLTCFAISPFRGGLARYTWTMLFATFGLFSSLVCSSLAWLYICQYIEVRQTTPRQAAGWLLIQGFLALIRLTIWIWDPRFDDFTMEKSSDPCGRAHLSEAQLVMLWYTQIYPVRRRIPPPWRSEVLSHRTEIPISHEKTQERAAYPPNWLPYDMPDDLRIPTGALEALDRAIQNVSSVFDLARRLRKGGQKWEEDVETFRSAERLWDIPGWLFMLWVDAHKKQNFLGEPDDEQCKWNAYNCRVIRIGAKKFHLIPYWTSCRHYCFGEEDISKCIIDIDEDRSHSNPVEKYQLEIFGDPGHMNRLIWSCNRIDQPDAALPRKLELIVGWHEEEQMPPLFRRHHLESFSRFLSGIEEHTTDMWRDLESIFARVES
ncbi:MAG: hypothetical protein Q9203_004156 [Teloschistes exilis]